MAAGKSDAFRSEVRGGECYVVLVVYVTEQPFNEKYGYMEKKNPYAGIGVDRGICTGCGKENTGIEKFSGERTDRFYKQ